MNRRDWLAQIPLALATGAIMPQGPETAKKSSISRIADLKITPIALPDPPLLAASGCHGPYFLRNIVELTIEGGLVGIGEAPGGEAVTEALNQARKQVIGSNVFSIRRLSSALMAMHPGCYAGIEVACLDACGQLSGRKLCELLGGPVRDDVEFAAYLFYRYAADHPFVLDDPRRVDRRSGTNSVNAIDEWGEVRTPAAMARLATTFRDRWGFRVFKLKAGVLAPELELESLQEMALALGPQRRLRIDPNARWTLATALRIGKRLRPLSLEYYEDPVAGQSAMAEVRRVTEEKMSTNMCVTQFSHIPEAIRLSPIDVLLCDHHYFGGFAGCQALEPICKAANWSMSQHSNSHTGISMAAMIHLAASIPGLSLASDTHYPWLPETADVIQGPKLEIRDGRMQIPEGPGLGVSLDQDKLARANETYRKTSMRRRDDAWLMRRFEPGWDGRPL